MRPVRMLNIGSGLLAGLWYGLIWSFSAQPATQSGQVSDGLLHRLLLVLSPAYEGAIREVQITAMEILSFYERKAAHMVLYFVLALLLWLLLLGWMRNVPAHCALTVALCALLAAVDEYHQTLVPGRSGELRDVLVDLAGAVIAVGGLQLIFRGIRFRTTRRTRRRGALLIPVGIAALVFFAFWPNLGLLPPFAFRMMNGGVEQFRALNPEEKRELLRLASPVLRETLTLAACGLMGCCAAGAVLFSGSRRLLGPAFVLAVMPPVLICAVSGQTVRLAIGMALLGAVLIFGVWALCDGFYRWTERENVPTI